jgi:hypothetical protein
MYDKRNKVLLCVTEMHTEILKYHDWKGWIRQKLKQTVFVLMKVELNRSSEVRVNMWHVSVYLCQLFNSGWYSNPTEPSKSNVSTSLSLLFALGTHHNTRDKSASVESHTLSSVIDQVGGSKLCGIKTHKVTSSLTIKYFPNTHNQQMESRGRYNFPIYWIPHVSKCFRFFVFFFISCLQSGTFL